MAADPTHTFHGQDHAFVQLVDGAFVTSATRAGSHVACRPGCTQCCVGVFPVGPADVLRIQTALVVIENTDPERLARIRERGRASWARLEPDFPGDPATGRLMLDPKTGIETDDFAGFGNDEPCPILDPTSGTCDLYAARPHTCRIFGLPLPTEGGYGVCELCFTAASSAEIASAALPESVTDTPEALDQLAINAGAAPGLTVLSYVVIR